MVTIHSEFLDLDGRNIGVSCVPSKHNPSTASFDNINSTTCYPTIYNSEWTLFFKSPPPAKREWGSERESLSFNLGKHESGPTIFLSMFGLNLVTGRLISKKNTACSFCFGFFCRPTNPVNDFSALFALSVYCVLCLQYILEIHFETKFSKFWQDWWKLMKIVKIFSGWNWNSGKNWIWYTMFLTEVTACC